MANSTLLLVGSTMFVMGFILLLFDGVTYGFIPPYSFLLIDPFAAGFLFGSIFLVVVGCILMAVAIKYF
jgi:hypothetical protein